MEFLILIFNFHYYVNRSFLSVRESNLKKKLHIYDVEVILKYFVAKHFKVDDLKGLFHIELQK